ncbi:hypothetical protein B9Z65_5913 [Elsinoe australis]|uniref:Uncharacterized protein n=1 Tax=Elsinoe australis TaxID=40998 RepID=A0A2P7YJD9_9PEZI|nr:hypothetical protein B9Z65_5913 [Elsinoe australis]
MSTSLLTRDEYTVGIVCALGTEETAMSVMLDQRHPPIPTPREDSNRYCFGSIYSSNVVIACLPAGSIGKVQATRLANDMSRSFRHLALVMMVGIGGGVWRPRRDMRLGDIAVCQPDGVSPGLVEWDRGKNERGFIRTGTLNQPSEFARNLLQSMKVEHDRSGDQITQHIIDAVDRHPRLKLSYCKPPDAHSDRLFRADYLHRSNLNCRSCDSTKVIKRAPRQSSQPKVFYGNIASGDQVVKNAVERDRIANLENIICFEMEAAGIATVFKDYLVVRGICDYADSHKHKQRQPWAAMTAAAFAKELLRIMDEHVPRQVLFRTDSAGLGDTALRRRLSRPAQQVRSHHGTGSMLPTRSKFVDRQDRAHLSDEDAVDETKLNLSIPMRKDRRTRLSEEDCIKALSYEGIKDRESMVDSNVSGTCSWLLEHPNFEDWLRDRGFMWIRGKPGSGKSTLVKYLVHEIRHGGLDRGLDRNYILSHFFYAGGSQLQKSADGLYRSLLHQLVRLDDDLLSDYIGRCAERCVEEDKPVSDLKWQTNDLLTLIQQFVRKLALTCQLNVIIDALDECELPASGRAIQQLWINLCSETRGSQFPIRLCISSRPYPEVISRFDHLIIVDESNHQDIQVVIQDQLGKHSLPRVLEIMGSIRDRAAGVFQWVSLMINKVIEMNAEGRTSRSMLQQIESAPEELQDIYTDLLDSIGPADLEQAFYMMQWVCMPTRPLTLEDIRVALVMDESCLRGNSILECLDLNDGYEDSERMEIPVLQSRDFYGLSLLDLACWNGQKQILQLLLAKGLRPLRSNTSSKTPLHWAVNSDAEIVEILLAHEVDADAKDKGGFTALHDAARAGNTNIVKALLAKRAQIDPVTRTGVTPLGEAAYEGHEEIVSLLLTKGASVDGILFEGMKWPPLTSAARTNRVGVGRLLLDAGADAKVPQLGKFDSLSIAAINGHLEFVKLLVERDPQHRVTAELDYQPGSAPVQCALESSHLDVAEYLLLNGANAHILDESGQSLLQMTIKSMPESVAIEVISDQTGTSSMSNQDIAHETGLTGTGEPEAQTISRAITGVHDRAATPESISRLLLSRGMNLHHTDQAGDTALITAVKFERLKIVRLLLEAGSNVNTVNNSGDDALLAAVMAGSLEILEILIAAGANSRQEEREDSFALHYASLVSSTAILERLLGLGLDINATDRGGHTPAHVAIRFGRNLETLKFLCNAGTNVSATDHGGRGLLHNAALYADVATAEYLLEKELDVNMLDSESASPLSMAIDSRRSNPGLVTLLLARGADPNLQTKWEHRPLYLALRKEHVMIAMMLLYAGADVHLADACGMSTLEHAAADGNLGLTQLLLNHGADINAAYSGGNTALLSAIEYGHEEITSYLLDRGAANSVVVHGQKAEHYACQYGTPTILQRFLDRGAVTEPPDMYELPLFYSAVRGERPEMVAFLLQRTTNTHPSIMCWMSPLRKAASIADGDSLRSMYSKCEQQDFKDRYGSTITHLLIWCGDSESLDMISSDVDLKETDHLGSSSIHYAARCSSNASLRWLRNRESSLDLNKQDNLGWTALHWAAHVGAREAFAWLSDVGADSSIKDKLGRSAKSYKDEDESDGGSSDSGSFDDDSGPICDSCLVDVRGEYYVCHTCEAKTVFCTRCHHDMKARHEPHGMIRQDTRQRDDATTDPDQDHSDDDKDVPTGPSHEEAPT